MNKQTLKQLGYHALIWFLSFWLFVFAPHGNLYAFPEILQFILIAAFLGLIGILSLKKIWIAYLLEVVAWLLVYWQTTFMHSQERGWIIMGLFVWGVPFVLLFPLIIKYVIPFAIIPTSPEKKRRLMKWVPIVLVVATIANWVLYRFIL